MARQLIRLDTVTPDMDLDTFADEWGKGYDSRPSSIHENRLRRRRITRHEQALKASSELQR